MSNLSITSSFFWVFSVLYGGSFAQESTPISNQPPRIESNAQATEIPKVAESTSRSSESIRDQRAITLDSQQLTLRQPNEELICKLGELRTDRDYGIAVRVTNGTREVVTVTRVQTSCGCVAATTEARKGVEPGAEFNVALSISRIDTKAVDRVVSLITEIDNNEFVFATIRLMAEVIRPVKISPTNIVIEANEDDRRVEFKLTSDFKDVSLKECEVMLVSDWASDQKVTEKTDHSLVASVLLAPEKQTEVTAQMFAKFSYIDKDGLHVTEIPIYLTKKLKLSVRPDRLKFLVDDANQVALKIFLFGQFDPSEPTTLVVYQCDKEQEVFKVPLVSTEVRATNERILVYSANFSANSLQQEEGFFKIEAIGESVFVPYQCIKE
jgi:hypothetical protein